MFQSLEDVTTIPSFYLYNTIAFSIGMMIFYWSIVALALLDAEYLWLPDLITLPGIALGVAFSCFTPLLRNLVPDQPHKFTIGFEIELRVPSELLAILAAALLILLIRWLYKLIRHREGIGLGDAKLMALLAAWLGLPGALLAFFLGIILGSLVAVVLLLTRSTKPAPNKAWSATKLPLGTFLCIGGIISALWGQPLIAVYLRWAGF
jgi:leader peptidase (prepilin peptidase)/N-methyltransferase